MDENDFVSAARALDRRIDDLIQRSRSYLAEAQATLARQHPPSMPNQTSLANQQIEQPVARTDEVSQRDSRGLQSPLSPLSRQGNDIHVQLPSISEVLAQHHNLPNPAPAPGASAIHPTARIHTIDTWLDDIPDRIDSALPPQQRGQKRTFGDMVDDWEVRRDPKGPRLGPVRKEDNPEGEMIQFLFGPGGERR